LPKLNVPLFGLRFLTVMALTMLGTCCALIHALNERVAQTLVAAHRPFPNWARAAVAALAFATTVVVAERVGLIALVDSGYRVLAWSFIAIFMIPILTYCVWRIARSAPVARAVVAQ